MAERIFWTNEPKWDAQNQGWYWEGQKLEGGHLKRVMKWLRPEEFGLDGYPLPNAVPPNPLPVYQQQPPPAPQPSAFNLDTPRPSQQVDQPLLNNVSLNEQSKAPGLAFFSDYRSHDSNLNRHWPSHSTSGGRYHKKHSDKNSSYQQVLPTHMEASFPPPSSQYTGSKNMEYFLSPPTDTKGFEGANQTQGVNLYSPDTHSWTAGSGDAVSHSSPAQGLAGPAGLQHSSYERNKVPATYDYPAQVHSGARWAGGPSNGNVGITEIQVKQNAQHKIKPVGPLADANVLLDSNFDVYPSSSFQPGKIIKVWWSEPLGMPTRGAHGSRLSKETRARTLLKDHQKQIWTGFRRFIIIRNFQGHCHGIPIYTYNRQGCTKHGVKQHEHGIIYEDLPGNTGQLLSNEKTLGFPSIRARTTNGEPMDNASRVNYAKITDIGHNLKVNFIAEVVPEDWNIAKNALKTSGFC